MGAKMQETVPFDPISNAVCKAYANTIGLPRDNYAAEIVYKEICLMDENVPWKRLAKETVKRMGDVLVRDTGRYAEFSPVSVIPHYNNMKTAILAICREWRRSALEKNVPETYPAVFLFAIHRRGVDDEEDMAAKWAGEFYKNPLNFDSYYRKIYAAKLSIDGDNPSGRAAIGFKDIKEQLIKELDWERKD